MKKRCISALLTFILIFSLTACGGTKETAQQTDGQEAEQTEETADQEEETEAEEKKDEKVTLTMLGKASDVGKIYLANIIEQYKAETGNNLEIYLYDDAIFEESAARDFEDGNAPDIFLHFHNGDLNDFDVAENFCYLNDQPWVDDLTDDAREYCQDEEGNLLGLPFWENSVSGCYYNKTLLDSLGLQPATTQAEFDNLCQQIADAGYTPICWPGNACTWMYQFGLDPIFSDNPELLEQLNRNELSYMDIPKMRDMVQWISDAAAKGWFGADYQKTGWDDISPMMNSGQAVMTFIWDTWFYTDFKPEGQYALGDFALMPIFMNTAEAGTFEGGNLNMMMVNKNSEHKEEALDFLSFCATPEHYNTAFEGISTESCFKGQTTNIRAAMVEAVQASIDQKMRPSVAASRVAGYSAGDMDLAVAEMLEGVTNVDECLGMMDTYRIREASEQGLEGFEAAKESAEAPAEEPAEESVGE